ncbi:hypothetical protein RF11_00055 [Thelohanellus kitauei]|uniref:Uncharacterized protein n=1 Tax=Thelohanellus kitauei TaxID=669202 RepID=A0A0C2J8C3_THEKT|nr:hypothetical protein RF11_00055 [Thelohanellus kitauei]
MTKYHYFVQNPTHTHFALARNPFTEEIFELINSDVAKTDFSPISNSKFVIKCLKSYSVMSETILRLLPFPTTHLCETGIDAEDDVRCDIAKKSQEFQIL